MDANCSDYVWNNPTLFFKSYYVKPNNTHCKSNVINHILFVILVTSIIGFIVSFSNKNRMQPIIVVLLLNLAYSVYWYFRLATIETIKEKQVEKFKIREEIIIPDENATEEEKEEVIGEDKTYPTAKNPFMNVLVDESKYNPSRSPAVSIQEPFVSTVLDVMFKTQFVNDPTDVFGRSQSQRQFYTTPSTRVPNDQESYQNWLYRIPGKTCKEGGREACAMQTGSAGAVIPWLTSDN
jgi:Ca2+/Na+ antiporter